MQLDLVPRQALHPAAKLAIPVAALCLAFLIGGMLVSLYGRSPLSAFKIYVLEPITDLWSIQEVLTKAVPLAIIATGLAFCFRANRWNIGAEGQFTIGGLTGGWAALVLQDALPAYLLLPVILCIGAAGGMAYALIPAWLRNRFGVNEILSSLMLVYIAQYWLDYMVRGPLRDPNGRNMPQSAPLRDNAILPSLFEGGRLNLSLAIAILVILVAAFIFRRSVFGYAITVAGEAPKAARFAGFDEKRMTLAVFAISGLLAGLAGVLEVSGQIGQLKPQISSGYGFTAIIVAFLGRLSPWGIALSSIILAIVSIGAEGAQIALKLPLDLAQAFQGILLFCVLAAETLGAYRLRLSFGR